MTTHMRIFRRTVKQGMLNKNRRAISHLYRWRVSDFFIDQNTCSMYNVSSYIRKAGYSMKFDTNMHSVFILHYRLIMCVKYRNRVIDDAVSERLRQIFERIAPDYHITVEEWNHDTDHVHVLFRAQPHTQISRFINAYKSASSRLIKKEFPSIREHLWKEMFWSKSYCLLTTGGVTADVIRAYIQTQGRKS